MSLAANKIKQLRSEALALAQKGKSRQALEKLAKLESLDPKEPDWPRRAAECHRLLGERAECMNALARAADGYVSAGMVVKAMAICKMMLAIDPQHPGALDWMSKLQRPLGMPVAPPPCRPLPIVRTSQAGPATVTNPEAATGSRASVGRKLVAAQGLVAVARAIARKTKRTQRREMEPSVQAPPQPALERASRTSGDWQVVDDADLLGPEASAPAPVISSLPPLSIAAELRSLVPSSRSLPGGTGTPSALFRLAIDPAQARGEQTLRQAREVLPAIPLFSEIDPSSLEELIRQGRLIHLGAGELVYRQDDTPECLYVVVNGSVAVIDHAASDMELYRLGENEFFGEDALISNEPRPATVQAAEACDLIAFDRQAMRYCISHHPTFVPILLRFLRGRMIEQLLRTSPLFVSFDTAQRRALSRRFEFIEVTEGALLIEQGTPSPGLFVLLSGAVDVTRSQGERETWIASLERGGMFGEISLLGRVGAIADVRCVEPGFALMLPASEFHEVIASYPPLLEVLERLRAERV
ncbi:MAG TPA: cyclic nucleotide-binding domain-containing protein [Polyangiaceae bacterium]|nr:cyclic nucleotide-binding domain-containing protein [Polyangiaceae bacterium]